MMCHTRSLVGGEFSQSLGAWVLATLVCLVETKNHMIFILFNCDCSVLVSLPLFVYIKMDLRRIFTSPY